ncbi:hypothetical protein VT84_10840 [Gemmata sp. SH-PL17]|uniref:hypothetical protein n=1 Tax=Gemmata sp. SH-PL17 TaxID=1630693 RepID=UPI00078CB2A2|nr:hypothetical protein [Gemmata sp. SH-PL17]AMV24885.1 hypothetical protein VT84_10840 [Gemmata sp. SH-PL17]
MLVRSVLVLAALLGFINSLALAAPVPPARDEAIRLAPPDAAIVFVVQNLRDHMKALSESPFAAWFPTSAHGKHVLNSDDFKKFTDGAAPVLGALGITPTEVLHDIIGDVVVFAYVPAPAGNPKDERSVILIRPRRPDALAKVLDALNDIQMKSKELKSLIERKYSGEVYFERQKPNGPSDFYCFRDGVFAFSQSEADIKAIIERDKSPKDKPPVLVERLTKLGVADAAVVLLVNPRAFDSELAEKAKNANPDEKGFLTKFAEVWSATDAAALYLSVEKDVELGVSLHYSPEKLPAALKPWIVGERTQSALWSSVPDNAILALAGRAKANDIIDVLAMLAPTNGKPGVRETLEQTLGPVVGKDKLPLVLDALGPDAVIWAAPPAKGTAVPVVLAAVKVQADSLKGAEASKALVQALEYGFQVGRIAYNASHKDQIELKEEKDGDAVIKLLASDGFPMGVRPCFALKAGYLLVSSSPDAIKSFQSPPGAAKTGGDVTLARFNAISARDYLTAHTPQLAKLLAEAGAGEEKALTAQLGMLASVLEPLDKVELLTRGNATGMKVMLRVKTVKPLKK